MALRSPLLTFLVLTLLGCSLCFVAPQTPAARAARAFRQDAETARPAPANWVAEGQEAGQDAWTCLKAMAAICLGLVVAFAPLQSAEAARSGGRMGGGSVRAARPMPRSGAGMGASAGPRVSTGPNVSIGIGAPMISPFGYSPFGMGYGGFGLFGPPILPVPVPTGPSGTDQMIQSQQLRDERQIDSQKSEIAQLKQEIEQLKTKKQ
mmetsp:Transcript_39883/g.71692  ORF Transcript_39883/g.71692 Transcript_39883/m.71692 type:complete len:207 (-) Transcript_39883:83-703(-)|eukprot:CAMPEP_0197664868 /NCGR_PEP_ID=MMETSP1338-20131121/58898_1 /TAXON_ID=43686 ORGANISM="Pelagodinium beii, Strain RCC1491" /NCGR_SAMPLE_ID=MMETSP1338 /ASSEMBLY_ACC=CAM_ASM_000754 /LENGTH=206 /DNA_ID=CAMNT_0043243593 /DNA_START=67 /DNA_END=687 /DNA_ORIENTATION=+